MKLADMLVKAARTAAVAQRSITVYDENGNWVASQILPPRYITKWFRVDPVGNIHASTRSVSTVIGHVKRNKLSLVDKIA